MGFPRDGGAYTIAPLLATRPGRRDLASKDLGSQALRRKPDKTRFGNNSWMVMLGAISRRRSSKMAENHNNNMELL
jgi:hypothetical protein